MLDRFVDLTCTAACVYDFEFAGSATTSVELVITKAGERV